MTGTATDDSGNTSDPSTATAGDNPDTTPPGAPDVKAEDDGSVTITPPADKDTKEIEVKYTDEDGKEHTSTVTKGDDGKWTTTDPNLNVDPKTGKTTIPADKVKDGSEVTGTAKDDSGNVSQPDSDTAKDVTAPAAPDVKAEDDGSVTIDAGRAK